MAKKTSTKTETEQVAPVVNTTEPVVAEKKVKKAKAPKADAAPVTHVVAVEPATPVVDAHVESEPDTPVAEKAVEFLAKLQQLGVLISSLKAEYRTLEKTWSRELKVAQKQSSKRKRKVGNRAPSGFVKPTRISDELAKFLEKPCGSEMALTLRRLLLGNL